VESTNTNIPARVQSILYLYLFQSHIVRLPPAKMTRRLLWQTSFNPRTLEDLICILLLTIQLPAMEFQSPVNQFHPKVLLTER
jgi:hypothetical protein